MIITILRRFFAALSVSGIAATFLIYIQSLSGATIDEMLLWVIVLGVGAIALQIPITVIERSSLRDRTFFWEGFARGKPIWVVYCVKLFWLIAIAHFIWFFVQSDAAVPIIKDGQYVLSSRGRIRRVLMQTEYFTLKSDELRVFAALMVACYLMPAMYWCFPRNNRQSSESGRFQA